MKRSALYPLAIAVALLGGGCHPGLTGSAREALVDSEEMEIFTLNPAPQVDDDPHPAAAKDLLHNHRILGRAQVTDPGERAELGRLIDRSTRRFADGEAIADCFSPRHALRVERGGVTIDILICYQCANVHVYGKGWERDLGTRDIQSRVDPIFAAHGLQPVPRL